MNKLEKIIEEKAKLYHQYTAVGDVFKEGMKAALELDVLIHVKEVQALVGKVKLYEHSLQLIHDVCICERFVTEGFDYHEQHPRRKENNGGKRPKTPRDIIEQHIGFDWEYEKTEGVCKSWKVLKLDAIKPWLEHMGEK